MALSNERTEAIAKYLLDDEKRAQEVLSLSPEEAVSRINSDGNNFSVEEIQEFGENLKYVASQNGELSEDQLSDVSGGVIAAAAAAVYLTCVSIGVALGSGAATHWKW